ncbi:hypothetical protein H4582DRAFT_2083873 [Lactarius indigo]|nr:hypothetical protein H4582DRAFT_2083873 [Lactarius indigo]
MFVRWSYNTFIYALAATDSWLCSFSETAPTLPTIRSPSFEFTTGMCRSNPSSEPRLAYYSTPHIFCSTCHGSSGTDAWFLTLDTSSATRAPLARRMTKPPRENMQGITSVNKTTGLSPGVVARLPSGSFSYYHQHARYQVQSAPPLIRKLGNRYQGFYNIPDTARLLHISLPPQLSTSTQMTGNEIVAGTISLLDGYSPLGFLNFRPYDNGPMTLSDITVRSNPGCNTVDIRITRGDSARHMRSKASSTRATPDPGRGGIFVLRLFRKLDASVTKL